MSYDNWRARLAIAEKYKTVAERRKAVAALKINFSQPGEADCGYYRKPITEKDPSGNGLNIIKGWIPVSYFMHGDKLVGIIGAGDDARDMTDDEVGDEQLWSYVVSHPISYETYRAVVDNGEPWPDQPVGKNTSIIETLETAYPSPENPRVIERTDNLPPEVDPLVEHKEGIDNAIGAARDLKVATAEDAARVAGAANILRDRRLAVEKIAKARVTPLKLAYESERDKWLPMVKRAKEAEDALRRMVTVFEVAERKRIAAAQLEAMEKQREQDEANARAADRAIANAEPEPPPVVEGVQIPRAPEPVKPTYGSYTPPAKPLKKFAVIVDDVAVYRYFSDMPVMIEFLQKLATTEIRNGIEVPGTTVREGIE